MPPEGTQGLYQPRFSPTGERIALLAFARHGSVWVMQPDGANLHRLLGRADGLDW